MIRVIPGNVPSEFDITAPSSLASVERQKAINFFKKAKNSKGKFNFSVYTSASLKRELKKSFFGKCAYCEGRIANIEAMDIEHYRPKKAIKINGVLNYPGYYWLGADFNNLLPSCPACNRIRKYEMVDGTCITSGKGNEFPISDERYRAKKPGDEINEGPELLHPYFDKPHEHLRFLPDGQVRYKTNRGDCSIRTYALFRPELVLVRREKINLIKSDIVTIVNTIEALNKCSDVSQFHLLCKTFRSNYKKMHYFMRGKSEFAAVARNMIHPVLNDLFKEYKKATQIFNQQNGISGGSSM